MKKNPQNTGVVSHDLKITLYFDACVKVTSLNSRRKQNDDILYNTTYIAAEPGEIV